MTRLLVPTPERTLSGNDSEGDDKYLSRLAKFIPSESGTLFTIVNAYLLDRFGVSDAGSPSPTPEKLVWNLSYHQWGWIVFVVCFVGNLVLLNRMYDTEYPGNPLRNKLKMKHITASSVGFVVWAYAIKSPVFFDLYESFIAALAIGLFLILVGRIKPPVVNT